MVAISEEVEDILRSIYLHEIANNGAYTPKYDRCIDVLSKLDKPVNSYLRKPSKYLSWARDGMLMTSVCGYNFGFYWNEEETLIDIVEVFKDINEGLNPILSLMERLENLH